MAGLVPFTQTKVQQLVPGSPSQSGMSRMNSHFTTNPIDGADARTTGHAAGKHRVLSDVSSVIIVDKHDTFEVLDAEVDALKRQLYVLRQEAKASNISMGLDESRLPVETAASRLQRAHELLVQKVAQQAPPAPVAPPSPSHFPQLASTNEAIQSQARRTSYASMATQGMLDASGKSLSGQRVADGIVSDDDTAKKASSGVEFDYDNAFSPKCDTTTTASSLSKQSPRFAQPTLAHSRRAGETLRKRKPLPSAWAGSPPKEGTSESEKLPERIGSVHKSRLPVSTKKNYMSPTKAAVQRTIDTKQSSPRSILAKINTNYPALNANHNITSPISIASSSDVVVKLEASPSHVKCMLEQMRPMRRISQGLLQPIRAKLDKIGILKDDAHDAKLDEVASTAEQPATELGTKKAVPPHIRAAMREAATSVMLPALRATAQEFKPMLATLDPQPQHFELTDDFVMRFFSDDEWTSLPSAVRRAICAKREEITGVPGRTKQRYTGTGPFSPTPGADIFTTTPLRTYGRAPAPPLSPFTPPDTKPHWTITVPSMAPSGGWAGGDGREIKFTGWGPDAERERQTRLVGEEALMEPPLAPRSQQQWARLAYAKAPCNTLDVIGAVEQLPMPFAASMAGFCGSCAALSGY